MRCLLQCMVAVAALLAIMETPAGAEFSIMVYFGKSLTGKSDLHLKKGDADLHFHDARWDDKSFSAPIFYGIRASYWFDHRSDWGVAVDFTHAKAILSERETVQVTGSRNGSPVDAWEPVSDSIRHFELSHGLNMVTFNGLHRWFVVGSRDKTRSGDLQGYTGLGAGFSVPHVEAHMDDGWTGRYQFPAGPVVNGMAGLNYDFAHAVAGALEYKLSYADVHGRLNRGGSIETATWTHQFISGLAGNFSP